jgi:hypothetical protein
VLLFWWYHFFDATFGFLFAEEGIFGFLFAEDDIIPSFDKIVETIGDYVGPIGIIGLTLFGVLAKYKLSLI